MKILDKVMIVILIIGALVWGIIGLFNYNIVESIFGNMSILTKIIYCLVGISGLYGIKLLFKDI